MAIHRKQLPIPNVRKRSFFEMDSPQVCEVMQGVERKGPQRTHILPLKPIATKRVCARFFCFAYNVSNNQIKGDVGARALQKRKSSTSQRDAPAQWDIETWLNDTASLFQVQPDQPLIMLPFANRKVVAELFERDMAALGKTYGKFKYQHFTRVWRSSHATKHIKSVLWLNHFNSRQVANICNMIMICV